MTVRLNLLSTFWKQFHVEIAYRMERVTSSNLVSQSDPSSAQRDMLSTGDLTSKPTWSPHHSFLSDWTEASA
jgi:hypothetical protein